MLHSTLTSSDPARQNAPLSPPPHYSSPSDSTPLHPQILLSLRLPLLAFLAERTKEVATAAEDMGVVDEGESQGEERKVKVGRVSDRNRTYQTDFSTDLVQPVSLSDLTGQIPSSDWPQGGYEGKHTWKGLAERKCIQIDSVTIF